MLNPLKMFSALFTAVLIFVLGNNLLNTLLSVRMADAGYAMTTTGFVLSSYYTGLLAGFFLCHRLVERIGHIRAFTAFAAVMTASTLLYGLYISPWFWGLLRFSGGITTFGLFVVIESWLNECSELHQRGRVFAVHMTLSYMGTGLGQQLLNLGNIENPRLFVIAGILCGVPPRSGLPCRSHSICLVRELLQFPYPPSTSLKTSRAARKESSAAGTPQ